MENILKDMSADELLTLAMIAEIKEFKAAAGELKYSPNKLKTWDGDIDVAEFVLPKQLCVDEEECGGYDERPIILCDFDNGPVNVCVERVILRDGDYNSSRSENHDGL